MAYADSGAGAGSEFSSDPNRAADWSFSFGEGDHGEVPPPHAAIVDELEFAKATLQHALADVARSSTHLQSLVRRAHRDGMTADELAVHAGVSIESVTAVLGGGALIEQLFGQHRPQ